MTMDMDMNTAATTHRTSTHSIRNASVTAGASLLIMAALSIFGNFVAVERLVTPGDAAQTAADITASAGVFRLGIAALLLVAVLDVVVAWALYRVFRPVNGAVSMLAAWFRLGYAGVFTVAISQLAGVPRLLSDNDHLAALGTGQVHAQVLVRVNAFGDIWDAGFLLFGFHLLVVGSLAFRAGYVPRFLGVLVAISGLGYAVDSFAALLAQDSWNEIAMVTFIGEFLLALWLVIRGGRRAVREPVARQDPSAPAR